MRFIERTFEGDQWPYLFVVRWNTIPADMTHDRAHALILDWCRLRFDSDGRVTPFRTWGSPSLGAFVFRSHEQAMEFKLTWVGWEFEND